MNRDQIIRMARESSPFTHNSMLQDKELVGILERFAALVAASEREECAKLCESLVDLEDDTCNEVEMCAAAIRARGEK